MFAQHQAVSPESTATHQLEYTETKPEIRSVKSNALERLTKKLTFGIQSSWWGVQPMLIV